VSNYLIIEKDEDTTNCIKRVLEDFPDFYYFAQHGFIVVVSNYRYVGKKGKYG